MQALNIDNCCRLVYEALWINLRLLRTFACVLGGKIRTRAILKENKANYISLESLINVDSEKNINCGFLQFRKRKSQTTTKMTMCHSFRVSNSSAWQNIKLNSVNHKGINHQKCVSIFRYSDWLFFCEFVEQQRMRDGHCIEDCHVWNIINFKNPRHTFNSFV